METDKKSTIPPPPEQAAKAGEKFIFLDAAGNRWSRLKWITSIIIVFLFISLTIFTKTLFVPSQLKIPAVVQQLKGRLKALQENGKAAAKPPLWLNFAKKTGALKTKTQPAGHAVIQIGRAHV
jgi:membrane protein insertase Oxa1/YidC/SpoIIIJ